MKLIRHIQAIFALSATSLSLPFTGPQVDPDEGSNTTALLSRRANNDYSISFYNNNQCTGQAYGFSGVGTLACTAALGAGVVAYILVTLDPDYQIEPYSDTVCGAANALAEIDTDSPKNTCTGLGNGASSFEVTEAPPK